MSPKHNHPTLVFCVMDRLEHSAEELFQNVVLRPIIKNSHKSLMIVMCEFLKNENPNFGKLDVLKQQEYIHQCLSKNLALKAMLKGMVLGSLGQDDLTHYYQLNIEEVNKRMNKILEQRFQTNLMELI